MAPYRTVLHTGGGRINARANGHDGMCRVSTLARHLLNMIQHNFCNGSGGVTIRRAVAIFNPWFVNAMYQGVG